MLSEDAKNHVREKCQNKELSDKQFMAVTRTAARKFNTPQTPTVIKNSQEKKLTNEMDLKSFRHNGTKCNKNADDNIIDQCDHLKRLSYAVKFYKDNKNKNNKAWQ
eukprot:72996_1